MKPEHTAYQNSPHAKVLWASCHVGPGAGWYVRSKLSGAYQVYATLAKKYPKPIPTPIKNLRPAREVCEQCHWPQKFYAHKLRLETHYINDEENTRWDIRLIMKIGAEHSALGSQLYFLWILGLAIPVTDRIIYRRGFRSCTAHRVRSSSECKTPMAAAFSMHESRATRVLQVFRFLCN